MLIAILNKSTVVTNDNVKQMIKAVKKQMILHIAPAWNQIPPEIKFFENDNLVPGYAWIIRILDDLNQASNLKYSYKMDGKINGFIFAKTILNNDGTIFGSDSKISVCSELSQELCKLFIDRFSSQWANGLSSEFGNEYACEPCSPVESDFYTIEVCTDTESGYFPVINGKIIKNINTTLVCSLSNFIFPSWFNVEARDYNYPYDYLKKLYAPYKMNKGGLLIMRNSTSNMVNYVYSPDYPDWKKEIQNNFNRRNFI